MPASSRTSPKRDEILDVASRLFYEQGYHQTGVQQIISEADTARGTFYSHFESKEALGLAWLKARHLTWNGWLEESIRSKSTAAEKILGIFDFLGQWMEDCGYRGCAFLNTLCEIPASDDALRDEIRDHKRELHQRFQDLVAEHHPNQPKSRTKQIGSTLFLLFEGTLIEMQNFREQWPIEAARKQAKSLL